MRLRLFIFALLAPLGAALILAAPSPAPSPTPTAKPAPPLKPTGPVRPLPDASPSATSAEKPSRRSKAKSSPSPSESSSPSPTPKPSRTKSPPPLKPDAELDAVADEYLRGYLAARPLKATALGFHEYDGRINEHTRLAIDAELARLRRFDDRLSKFEIAKLSPRGGVDLRLLQAAIKRELFLMDDLGIYEHDPLTYARAIDVGVFAKRKAIGGRMPVWPRSSVGCIVRRAAAGGMGL